MKNLRKTLISLGLVASMLASSPLGTVKAAADGEGKYVSEVYVAYGKSEDEAAKWLKDNGWEPVKGDLGKGKASVHDTDTAAVLGIHRTGNPSDAITDLAVMNMKGAYSFDMYTDLVNQKKVEINSFLDTFIPVLEEYRANLNGEGSEAGKARAEMARCILNKFYDGEVDGEYALNDTGKPLGDLLSSPTRYEYGEENYDALPKEDKMKYGDLQQIVLESTPEAVLVVEEMLTMAADTSEESWLDRLTAISEGEFDTLPDIDPGTSESAFNTLIAEKYEDAAVNLSGQWSDVHDEILWYNEYNESKGLVMAEGEAEEDYGARLNDFLTSLEENDNTTYRRYSNTAALCGLLEVSEYSGEWGETLYDFFMPEDGSIYTGDFEKFYSFAAALSDGQRAGIDFLSLQSLIMLGTNDTEAIDAIVPDLEPFFNDSANISIYSGMNRQIFRDGVALTSEALAEKNKNRDPYNGLFAVAGVGDILAYSAFAVGAAMLLAGQVVLSKATAVTLKPVYVTKYTLNGGKSTFTRPALGDSFRTEMVVGRYEKNTVVNQTMKKTGIYLSIIGGAIMLGAAVYKGWAYLDSYYHVDMTRIPTMIVDEADIVTYKTDGNGNQILDENGKPVKDVNFDQFMYYDSVKCNRQLIGINKDAQKGVDKYEEWGCGSVADLNCDYGKEWLALYTNKSSAKGNPVLADSLTIQYGSEAMPENCTKTLHTFRNTYAFNVANETYSYNDKMNGVYLFWNEDPNAYGTAAGAAGSVFGTGLAALFGIGGLGLGILGTMIVMMPKRKRENV